MIVVGIALVVDELRKGQRLVFRYPEAIPSFCFNTPLGRATLKYHREYLSLTPIQFAKLFRPKHSLCNQTLELDIGDLKYISYPLICEDGISTMGTVDTEKYEPTEKVISLFNVVVCVVRDSALAKLKLRESHLQTTVTDASTSSELVGADPIITALGLQNSFKKIEPETLKRAVKDFSMALLFEERRQRYVSKQVKLVLELVDSDGKDGGEEGSNDDNIDRTDAGIDDAVSSALAKERHTSPMENNINANSSGSTAGDVNINISSRNQSSSDGNSNLLSISCREEILQRSSLANEMRAVYHDLIGKVLVDVTINNSVHIKVPLRNAEETKDERNLVLRPYQTLLPIADEEILRNILSTLEKHSIPVIPSTSLKDDETRQWSSVDFKDVLFRADPTKTFDDLCSQMELGLNELTPLVQRICQSGLGRVISVITSSTVYQVHPHFASSENAAEAAKQFWSTYHSSLSIHGNSSSNISSNIHSSGNDTVDSLQFAAGHTMISELTMMSGFNYTTRGSMIDTPTADRNVDNKDGFKKLNLLGQVLNCFNGNDNVREAIKHFPKGLDTFAVDVIIWLLRWNIIEEIEIYLIDTLLFSKLDDYEDGKDGSIDQPTERGIRTEEHIFTQHALIQDEALLDRLKPYLDGNTPMSEMLYLLATQIDAGCRRLFFDANDDDTETLMKGASGTSTARGITVDDDSVNSSSNTTAIPMFDVNADDILALVVRSKNRIIVNRRPIRF